MIKKNLEEFKAEYAFERKYGMGSEIRDNYHTMSELYFHRMTLFAFIVSQNKSISWKSRKHSNGTMFSGMFIVGINTPTGCVAYHYQLKYWDFYDCKELENAPEWDGTTADEIYKLFSIKKGGK